MDARPTNVGIRSMEDVRTALADLHSGKRPLDGATAEDIVWAFALDSSEKGADVIKLAQALLGAKHQTPSGKLAIEKFIANANATVGAMKEPPSRLAKWMGASPKLSPWAQKTIDTLQRVQHSALDVVDFARAWRDAKSAVVAALEELDPVLAQTITQDSKYAEGLEGMAKQFPALQEAIDRWKIATPAEKEEAVALMKVTLAPYLQGPSMSSLLAEIAGGKRLDHRIALDVARAAVLEIRATANNRRAGLGSVSFAEKCSIPNDVRAKIEAVLKAPHTTELGVAFLQGFLQSENDSVSIRFSVARRSVADAKSPVSVIDDVLPQVDPELSAKGHSELWLSGLHPVIQQASRAIEDGENPRAQVLQALQNLYAG